MDIELRRIARRSALPLALGLALASGGFGVGSPSAVDASQRANRQAFHDEMRTLWAGDHIVWTRCVIVSAGTLSDGLLPDTGATIQRLLANQTAIGNAFKPFYGEAAGDELTRLLEIHINTAAELILAAKAGDADAVADASSRWYANADEIAAFLNGLNPRHWPLDAVDGLLEAHLDLTLEEAVARLNGDYEGDIAAYDRVHAQILTLADALSAGIIAQFPQKFAG
jgi:hypothetical protein